CDALGRDYSYPPFWMALSWIPLGIKDTTVVGWALDFSFLVSLVFLPAAKRWWEPVLIVLATLSTMVVFALERANPDLLMFILALVAGFLAMRASLARFLTYPIALFAAAVKYYPITVMILSVRERIANFVAINLAALCVVALFVTVYLSDIERGIPLIATGSYFLDFFGARTLPSAVAQILEHTADASSSSVPAANDVAVRLYLMLVALGGIICWAVLRSGRLRGSLALLAPDEHIFLVIGSVLMVGCFFAGQNLGYRGIFFLFVLPGLLALSRIGSHRRIRALGALTAVTVVFLMWGECIRQNLSLALGAPDAPHDAIVTALTLFWFLRELLWWWPVSVMTAILLVFLWESEARRGLSEALTRRLAGFRRS
ncbi:MAG TPA: hypothetical protein VJN67_14150, partial [Stellaceae bacterium]|nr:hypothetical protein [Stellaceae bacterium]